MKKTIAAAVAAAMMIGMTSFANVGAASTSAAAGTDNSGSGFVQTNGNYFVLDGKPFYYEGANNYYMNYAPNYMIDDVLNSASKMNLKVLRCWAFLDGKEACGCIMQSSLGVYDDSGFERLDYTISHAEKLGIKLILPMVNNWDDFGGMNQYVKWVGASSHDDFFTNTACKTGYKNWIKHLLNHVNKYTGVAYKDDPTIMAWELANEPRCQTDPTGNTLVNWADEMSTYVKSIDSKHLCTVGDEGFFNRGGSDYCYNGGSGVDWDRLINLPNIDFETMHLYPDGWGKTIDWSIQYINDHIDAAQKAGKPVIMEEYGTKSDKIANYTKFNDALYKSGELGSGAAGSMFWLLTGVGFDGNSPYPDYDGFDVKYQSDVAALVSSYEAKMEEKNNIVLGNNSSIDPQTVSFDLYKPTDVSIAVELNGNTLTGIYNGSAALVAGKDYIDNGDSIVLTKDYLSTLEEGTVNLKFYFSAGLPQTLTVSVTDTTPYQNSEISPNEASFDLYTPSDISIAVALNGNTLKDIYNGTSALVKGTDYTVAEDGTVTLLKSYLSKQSVGTLNLKFDFNRGADPMLAITIVNTAPVQLGTLQVKEFNANTQNTTNGIMPRFMLVNTGDKAVDLSTVKIRYYFTEDGTQDENFWCDWSSVGSSNIIGKFVKLTTPVDGADTYLEISFASGAGSIAPGAKVEVQARFSKADWSNYDQSNDYSYNSASYNYAEWTKSPVFVNDILEYGINP